MVDLPSQSLIIYILDMIGVFACTVAATMLAKRLKFDISGALVVSFADLEAPVISVTSRSFRDGQMIEIEPQETLMPRRARNSKFLSAVSETKALG